MVVGQRHDGITTGRHAHPNGIGIHAPDNQLPPKLPRYKTLSWQDTNQNLDQDWKYKTEQRRHGHMQWLASTSKCHKNQQNKPKTKQNQKPNWKS